jgi:beta-lactamase regulating signal transducer with metallopeptidase domain
MVGRGNRAFAAFIATCAATFVLVGMGACILLGIVGYRVQRDGFEALTARGSDVRPALVFLVILAAGSVAGLWSLRQQVRATRRLQARVEELRVAASTKLLDAATQVGVAGRIDMVEATEPLSFTHGLGAARIVVSRGLAESLSDEELIAVLEHERYHVRNLDPLKVFVTRLLTPMLFFLPALRELRSRYVADRELAADRRVLRRHGQRALAGALYKVVGSPMWVQLSPAAALGGGDALEARVRQLETGEPPKAPRFSRPAVVLSALGAAVLLMAFSASVFAFGGPSALARLCRGA